MKLRDSVFVVYSFDTDRSADELIFAPPVDRSDDGPAVSTATANAVVLMPKLDSEQLPYVGFQAVAVRSR